MNGTPVVQVEHLVKRYKELIALDHFDLTVEKGKIFGLLGPNGSGKTTAINCMLALLTYDKGSIQVFGEPMTPDRYDSKKKLGVVMQNVAVIEELTVYENIDYFCGLYIKDKKLRNQYVKEAITFVGLDQFKDFRPKKLSGGLLRRLNIACGIAHKPELIILDEPTVAVDPQSRNRILEGIQELNRQGATIIYTSHYMEEVEQICTRVAIIDKGKNLAMGTISELKQMIRKSEEISIEIPVLPQGLQEELKSLPHVYETIYENQKLRIYCSGGNQNLLQVLELLREKQAVFGRVFSERPTLNDVFLEMTGTQLRD